MILIRTLPHSDALSDYKAFFSHIFSERLTPLPIYLQDTSASATQHNCSLSLHSHT